MTDELLMRLWADAHDGFSADLDRGILKLDRYLRGNRNPNTSIGEAYASSACMAAPAEHEMSGTARTALAGLSACLATMGLLVTVALLATANMHPAAAYAIPTHMIVA
jgi:hypothetical protein